MLWRRWWPTALSPRFWLSRCWCSLIRWRRLYVLVFSSRTKKKKKLDHCYHHHHRWCYLLLLLLIFLHFYFTKFAVQVCFLVDVLWPFSCLSPSPSPPSTRVFFSPSSGGDSGSCFGDWEMRFGGCAVDAGRPADEGQVQDAVQGRVSLF